MEITNKKWYDRMFKQVKEVLENLAMMEAAVVGYVSLKIEGQDADVSWTKEVVTVSSGKYKWQLPILWFIGKDEIEMITTENTLFPPPARTDMGQDPGPTPGPTRLPVPAVIQSDDDAGDAFPTVGERVVDDEADRPPGLLGAPVSPHPGVPSAAELAARAGS